MLKSLSIQNYALIDALNVSVEGGFTAITGETGSGKSILLGAFGLLLGERADAKSIRNQNQKCVVEAIFDLQGMSLEAFFSAHDLDFDMHTTVRREIAPGGKSRTFINDTPAQLGVLKALGAQLVDIHSQHQNSLLSDRTFQFSIVDAFAGNSETMSKYQENFVSWKDAKTTLDAMRQQQSQWQQEMDYIQFQWQELEKANLAGVDQEVMEQELNTLNNAEQIRSVVASVYELLDGTEQSAIAAVNHAKMQLAKIAAHHVQLVDFHRRLESHVIEMRELARDIESFGGSVHVDDRKAEQLGEQLSQLYHLQKKHRVNTVQELRDLEASLSAKTAQYSNSDEAIAALELKVQALEGQLQTLATQLHELRKSGARKAEQEIAHYFKALSMEHAQVEMRIEEGNTLHALGSDEISFLFKANKGGQLLPIQKVASGGEISRVMLAIKASISKHRRLPVLILDEIDQGVSGEVGLKIGQILKEMSGEMQLLVITHLPQIAGKADFHWKVRKFADEETTYTEVVGITGEDRVNELAEMLSGKKLTAASLANAKELLS
jgi:DNA repair protein RecN (Recombination protein N)